MVGSFLNTAARPTLKNVFIKDYQNLTVVIEQVIPLRDRTKPSVNSEDHSAPASAATQIRLHRCLPTVVSGAYLPGRAYFFSDYAHRCANSDARHVPCRHPTRHTA